MFLHGRYAVVIKLGCDGGRREVAVSAQEVTSFKMKWCWCSRDLVEHECVGRLDFGRTRVEVLRCPKCQSLKCVELTLEEADSSLAQGPGQD